ncbi:hypothetical protein [Streptomyces sp. NRRL F-2580]|uniref:hypothetical protein n=1 Tax=Streptomyces sp. NRRL F-2580 TaxID=1463841 RepID=UPI0004CB8930|nr:hypothetical protein [Streptomyces sp. NRRL F-2580]
MILAACAAMLGVMTPTASAAPNVKVTVTVDRIKVLRSSEEGACGSIDWYAKVFINGVAFNNEDSPSQDELEGQGDISPGWEFSTEVDVATLDQSSGVAKFPVTIEVWDEDGGFCLGDDQYDASQAVGRGINFQVAASPCRVFRGSSTGAPCGSGYIDSGTAEDAAEVTYSVAVDDPASAPGLRIRCTSDPVAPTIGTPVTVTATALDGAMMPTIVADELQIVAARNRSTDSVRYPLADHKVSGVNSTSVTFTPTEGGDLVYGCRLREGTTGLFTGWRRVDTNPGTSAEPRPISYTGPRASRIDIVFVADRDTYTSSRDPRFLDDVRRVVETSYYGFNDFLANQDKFNFWIARAQGRADDANDGDCDHDLPAGWDDTFAFADAGAILHRKNQRDCALRGDRIFSGVVDTAVRSDALQVITHESGHQPFGLADEYPPDGGYFQQDVAPNVYEDMAGCIADAPALGREATACRRWERPTDWWPDPDWFSSEPAPNDVMYNNTGPANAADIRRYVLIFGDCASAKC